MCSVLIQHHKDAKDFAASFHREVSVTLHYICSEYWKALFVGF